MPEGRSPVLPVLLFSAACCAVTALVLHLVGQPFTWPFAVVLAWFTLITLILLTWQERSLGDDVRPFIRRFMGGLVLKLLISLLVLAILVKAVDTTPLRALAGTFVLLYFAFLVFSTIRLAGQLRRIKKP